MAATDELDRWRARLDYRGPIRRALAGRLRRDLEAESVAASTSMEGVPVTLEDVHRILAGDRPSETREEDAALVRGYRDAMSFVLRRADDEAFQWGRELLVGLHDRVLAGSWGAGAGRFRSGPAYVVDGRSGDVVFQPPPAENVPELVDRACAVMQQGADHPAIGAAWIHAYGGDLSKALEALADAQSTIGRQGTELGELRELKQQSESLQSLVTLQQQASSVDWEEAIAENPEQAIHLALQYQNPQAFDEALRAWAVDDPIKAFTFLQEIQQHANSPEPTTLDTEIEALKSRHPDIQQRLPAIQAEAERRPALARLLNDEDPGTRAQALEDLYVLSRSQETPDTSKAARRAIPLATPLDNLKAIVAAARAGYLASGELVERE